MSFKSKDNPDEYSRLTVGEIKTLTQVATYDGKDWTFTPRADKIPDGTYLVIFKGGDIVGVAQPQVASYTPSPYVAPAGQAPIASGGDDIITLDPDPRNLLSQSGSGLLATVTIKPTQSVTVTGDGTQTNPYQLTASVSGSATSVQGDNETITVSGSGTAQIPYKVSMADVPSVEGEHNGFRIDKYGRVISLLGTPTGPTVIAQPPLRSVTNPDTKVTTISMADETVLGYMVMWDTKTGPKKVGSTTPKSMVVSVMDSGRVLPAGDWTTGDVWK